MACNHSVERNTVYQFFKRIPVAGVANLRSLHVYLTVWEPWLVRGHEEWTHAWDILAEHGDLPKLSLTVDPTNAENRYNLDEDFFTDYYGTEPRYHDSMDESFVPLEKRKGLKRLAILLTYPRYVTDMELGVKNILNERQLHGDSYSDVELDESTLRRFPSHPHASTAAKYEKKLEMKRHQWEKDIEKRIMGPDYDRQTAFPGMQEKHDRVEWFSMPHSRWDRYMEFGRACCDPPAPVH